MERCGKNIGVFDFLYGAVSYAVGESVLLDKYFELVSFLFGEFF